MKTAFAVWNHRIAPVFDVARQVHIVETESGRIVGEAGETLPNDGGEGKGLRLAGLGVDTLVCGAISRTTQAMVAAYGIRTIPFVAGELREVIRAWLSGALEKEVFAMPGCGGQGQGRGGQGQGRGGQGQGKGRGNRGPGRMGGPKAAGPAGDCVCPKCGRREPHQRGIPCNQRQCPACGAAMARE